MKRFSALLATSFFCLTGCSEPAIEQYAANKPVFDIREYLNGDLEAWGVLINRDGSAEPQFFIKMKGTWKGNEGTLAEEFTYVSGEKKQRLWHFRVLDDHTFTGTAADVTGEGKGKQYAKAVNTTDRQQLPQQGKPAEVNREDWH